MQWPFRLLNECHHRVEKPDISNKKRRGVLSLDLPSCFTRQIQRFWGGGFHGLVFKNETADLELPLGGLGLGPGCLLMWRINASLPLERPSFRFFSLVATTAP